MDKDEYYDRIIRKHIEDLEQMGLRFGPIAKDNGTIAATSATRNESVNATKKDWSAADMAEFQRILSSNRNGQNNDNNKTTAAGLPYEPTAVLNQNQHHGQSQGRYRIRPRDIIDWTGR